MTDVKCNGELVVENGGFVTQLKGWAHGG
jgi:hypothetical protein